MQVGNNVEKFVKEMNRYKNGASIDGAVFGRDRLHFCAISR